MTIEVNPDNPLYSVPQVAKMFGVKESTIRRWIRDDEIKAIKIKNRWRVQHEEVVRVANREYSSE